MITLRCTKKLLKRLNFHTIAETQAPTTILGDWYANLLYTRPQQLVLCMNERTCLVVLVPARESNSVCVRFREATALLTRLNVPHASIEAEVRAMSEVGFGPTVSRSIVGCMREAAFALSFELERPRFSSLAEIELFLGENIYSGTKYRYPRDLALALFGVTALPSSNLPTRFH